MIGSCRAGRTARFLRGEHVKEFASFAAQARVRLVLLETATSLADLAAIPGNRFEALKGGRTGQYSIRINRQWRICFEWDAEAGSAEQVEIVDYH